MDANMTQQKQQLPYIDAPFSYVFGSPYFTLPAGTESRGNQVNIYTDAAFVWRSTQANFGPGAGSGFQFQFADQGEKLYSSDYIDSSQLSLGNAGFTPYPQFPESEFQAGSGIYTNVNNPFGGTSVFQLVLKGCKRFYDLQKACKMLNRTYNPYAAPGLNGVNTTAPDDEFVDIDTVYVYNSPLNFTTELVGQQLTLAGDSDFALRAIEVALDIPANTTLLRFYNSQGYYLSDNYIDSSTYNSVFSQPFVVFPEMTFPASSRIMIDINNVSGGGVQTMQILFRGVKRYRASNIGRKGR
jgi:hypothetical protein